MRLRVLALDYDGTLAQDGVMSSAVRSALSEARAHGIVIILVTGRILEDLRQVARNLQLFDVVVAENGAVLHFPASGRTTLLASPPPDRFVVQLRRHAIEFAQGACVIEADAGAASAMLSLIREEQAPLVLLFNRSRLMALPQGVSKSTGLHHALRILRLSEHNTVAIGDAENDHTLLVACELGVAVAWGSDALKAAADEVLPGDGPPAVAAYLRNLIARPRLSPESSNRRKLLVGQTPSGDPVELPVKGRNVLIVGEPRSGKSWAAGLLCEQLIVQRYSVCVIDPEGDYALLESLPGVVLLGGGLLPPSLHEVELALRHPEISVVVDLSKLGQAEKCAYIQALLPRLAALRQRTGLPHRIVLDEAHYFLHAPNIHALVDLELDGYTLITCCPSQLDPAIRESRLQVIATRLRDADDLHFLQTIVSVQGDAPAWQQMLGNLTTGEVMLLPTAAATAEAFQRCRLAPRLTVHVRHREKYVDMPVADHLAFVLTRDETPLGPRAWTLKEFVELLQTAPNDALTAHMARGDIARWIGEVFGDQPLAARINALEAGAGQASVAVVVRAIVDLIAARYSFEEQGPDPYEASGNTIG